MSYSLDMFLVVGYSGENFWNAGSVFRSFGSGLQRFDPIFRQLYFDQPII